MSPQAVKAKPPRRSPKQKSCPTKWGRWIARPCARDGRGRRKAADAHLKPKFAPRKSKGPRRIVDRTQIAKSKRAPRLGAPFRCWPWVGGRANADTVTGRARLGNQLLVEIHSHGLCNLTLQSHRSVGRPSLHLLHASQLPFDHSVNRAQRPSLAFHQSGPSAMSPTGPLPSASSAADVTSPRWCDSRSGYHARRDRRDRREGR